jgi:hypothetical protein
MQMSRRKIAAGVIAAGTAVTGAALVSQSPASAEAPANTMRFVSHDTAEHQLGKFAFASDGVDKSLGKVIGYDALIGTFHPKTNNLGIDVGVALKGGLIVVNVQQPADSLTGKGTILSGTGIYRGISGTITTKSPSQSSNITHVTLRFDLP